jgi:hypothetical protein
MTSRWLLPLLAAVLFASPCGAQPTPEPALLDTIQHASFNFFWNEANPANGLIKDRSTPGSPCSIASTGFGLSAIAIGIDHGWVGYEQGRERVLTTLRTFYWYPQGSGASGFIGYKGFFYHFLDMNTGLRTWDSELSSIDTALLLAGVLDVRQYFAGTDSQEVAIRELADSIYYRVDWPFMRNFNPPLRMGWKPGTGFSGFGSWIGYNEAMIMYLLALGSPSLPITPNAWTAWTSGYSWQTHYGYTYVNFPPLFGHQYSHCWVDYRNIRDPYMQAKGIDYYENSRRATLAQRAYCIANPESWVGYGADLWGITASDVPTGYNARGAPPEFNDDGTISPTAIGGSLPFAPAECVSALRNLYDNYRPQLWTNYGFRDAFNLTVNWFGPQVLGIDQGPFVLMIENYRNGATWGRMMSNAAIQTGLAQAGFVAVPTDAELPAAPTGLSLSCAPNPARAATTIRYRLAERTRIDLEVFDTSGRRVWARESIERGAGEHAESVDLAAAPAGVYWVRAATGQRAETVRFVHLR